MILEMKLKEEIEMTRRERLEAVVNGRITEELINECWEELKKLDERSARALERSKESEKHKEAKELGEKIYKVLGAEPLQADEIREALGVEGLTRQRVTAVCTNLVREGRANAVELKIKGKGKRKGYVKS